MAMRPRPFSHAQTIQTRYYSRHVSTGSNLSDPFASDPVRRSAAAVAICTVILGAAALAGDAVGTAILLTVGWLAGVCLIFCVPILIWSSVEEGVAIVQRRLHPPVEVLRLSPRVAHILRRHGLDTIIAVDRASDDHLLSLSNMDLRDVEHIRRAIRLWKYARWQAQGFPASGAP